MKYSILYEDNHLLVINKRPGELSQGDITGDKCVVDDYKLYIKEKYNKPGNVFLGLVHRIDRPVSGALLLARTSKALTRLTNMMKERAISKEYIALVSNIPPERGHLIHWLEKDPKNNKVKVFKKPGRGKEAKLSYKLLKVFDKKALVKISLDTGRSHQIRAQFSDIGHPIVGDLKYGYHGICEEGSIALHSYKLSLTHPVNGQQLDIVAPYDLNVNFKKENINELF